MIRYRLLAITTAALTATALATTVAGPAGAAAPHLSALAGYQAKVKTSTIAFTSDVKVPAVSCTTTGEVYITLTISAPNSSGAAAAVVEIACAGGQVDYIVTAAVDTSEGILPFGSVKVGDLLAVVMTETAGGAKVKLTDRRSHKSVDVSSTKAIAAGTRTVTAETTVGSSTFPAFKKVAFSDLTINGEALSAAHPKKFNEEIETSPNHYELLLRSSALKKGGKSFTDTAVKA